jgi:diaminopimelate epimerase
LETGRKLHLEIEPGTYLAARAGTLLASVADVVATGKDGYKFVKLDAGMTEILRPSLYAAQHPIAIYPQSDRSTEDQVIVGHCCESGDLLTPLPSDAGELLPRPLPEARERDLVAIGGAGAYCSTMAATNYNSFPAVAEVLVREGGDMEVIRSRQIGNDVTSFETAGQVRFHKFHGLGNDFLVVDERWTSTTRPEVAAAAKALCDRNRGIGADGVLVLLKPETAEHDVRLRIYNSDGSEPEMCGNGVRCAALYFHHFAEGPAVMDVDTYAGTIQCNVEGNMVRVGMGPPRLTMDEVPTTLTPAVAMPINVAGETVEVQAVGMGNPHCIVVCPAEDTERFATLERILPQIEVAPEFPEKTNVELTVVESKTRVRVKVWERGAGWTEACGTGACATVVATASAGLTERNATVVLPGGELQIEWGEDQVYMTGPAEYVCSGTARI